MRRASVAHVAQGRIGNRWVGVSQFNTYFQPPKQRPVRREAFTNVYFNPVALRLEVIGYSDAYVDGCRWHAGGWDPSVLAGYPDLLEDMSGGCMPLPRGVASAIDGPMGKKWMAALDAVPNGILAVVDALRTRVELRAQTVHTALGLGFYFTNELLGDGAELYHHDGAHRYKVTVDRDQLWATLQGKETP